MLKIENLSVKLKEDVLFRCDSVEIESGKNVLVIGENNTGKTIFLQSIHGEFRNYDGTILWKEKAFSKKKRTSILIDSTFHLIQEKSIYYNITLPFGKINSALEQEIIDTCFLGNLETIFKSKVKHCSRSDQKMIEIIRAVVQQPELILIDDIDDYFDDKKFVLLCKIMKTLKKTTVISTSKKRLSDFDQLYRIQNGVVVFL